MRSVDRMVFTLGLAVAVLVAGGVRLAEAGFNVWTSNGPEGGMVQALAIDPLTPSTLHIGAGPQQTLQLPLLGPLGVLAAEAERAIAGVASCERSQVHRQPALARRTPRP